MAQPPRFNFRQNLDKIYKGILPLQPEERRAILEQLTPTASPGFDFFFLVVLSGTIATLGLITNSPAVIIGAMLVAPLMSPIIAIGLASITGSSALLRSASSALVRGAFLAIILSTLVTLFNQKLPFISMQELPSEVLARIRPSPLDLTIALAGGMAAAYALTRPNLSAALPGVAIATALMPPLCTVGIGLAIGRWEVAGGALLLFLTNAIAIAFAATLVFFGRGFSASLTPTEPRLPRSLVYSALLTAVLLIPLTYYSTRFFQEASDNRTFNDVVAREVQKIGIELVEFKVDRTNGTIDLSLTIRTNTALNYSQVVNLQQAIVTGLGQPVSLKVNQIIAEQLDPLIPPTVTPTLTPTSTATPGPSPTATPPPTRTATVTPTVTLTATSTPTLVPTSTPTAIPTSAAGQVQFGAFSGLFLYQSPGGPVIGLLSIGQPLTVLYPRQILNGLVWAQVVDRDGRAGWVLEVYVRILTFTPTATLPASATPPGPPTTTPSPSAAP